MSKNCRDWDTVDFYCINCGNKSIPLFRAGNKKKSKGHRKNMYCPHCQHTLNHIECRNMDEVAEFLEDFENGVYRDEARAELEYERDNPRFSTLCFSRSAGQR